MRDECINAVRAAAGRMLNQSELQGIEDRIKRNQRQLAQADRNAYLAMTPEQRVREAGRLAAEELRAEAAKKKQRVALTIRKHDAIQTYLEGQQATHGMGTLESLKRVLAFVPDGKSGFQSIETRAAAIANDAVSQLVDTFEAIGPRLMGLYTNRDGVRALTHELFGQDSRAIVDAETAQAAKAAAAEWGKVAESLRTQFNAAGGQVGKLDDWRMPQHHSQYLVARAGKEKWTAEILGKLDRRRYVDEDGSMMDDAQITEFLGNAWETIATGGANKIEPGKASGTGMLANRHAEARSIHFRDAESYLDYQANYGGKDAYSAMMGHVQSLARDIAAVDTLGPNPDLAFRYWLDRGVKEASLARPQEAGKIQAEARSLADLHDYTSGRTAPIANRHIANGFDSLRSWLVATRLGSAFVTSITDNATMQLTAAYNGLSSTRLLRNQLATLNPANREELRMARRAALSLNTLIGEVNRFGAESMVPNFASKAASLTTRVSLLNAATEARRRAFGVTMYGSIGSTVERHATLADVEAGDRRLLASKGITEDIFSAWKKAALEDWGHGNDAMLTPESIRRVEGIPENLKREAVLKLIGMVDEEINMAVPEPGAIVRTMTKMGTQPGTWKGEIMRSFFLFKSFPLNMIMTHWKRGMGVETPKGKAAYLASFIAGTTILGAAAQQVSQVIAGRDPQDATTGKFWIGSLLKGGSLGLYGDFLFDTNTRHGNSPLASLAGPVAGYAEDLIGLTHGNLMKAAKGEHTHAGAEAIKLLKSNIPLQNLWYTKAATDRLIFNQLQEMASPGYLARVEARARRDFGQQFYWRPGSLAPDRPPNPAAAFGQQ